MTLEDIDTNIEKKIFENEEIIVYTFYELRVKENLTEEEMYNFLALAKIKLQNLDYKVYKPKQKYTHNHQEKKVKENELLVAIKNSKNIYSTNGRFKK